ncbi:alpha/beta hydrolase [Leifsonia kafniensis]|uniref:Alpha/beta hydrolase n=1 Tax=Leifsonia kafniensis TaxID=475957 RepID=A0ABP7K0D7_9MICO
METNAPTLTSLVLVPGHWLGGWAWDAVAAELRDRGHYVIAMTLPGLDPDDPDRTSRGLVDQVDALRSAVRGAGADGSPVVLVVHSGAGFPASVFLDEDPTAVSRIIYVDSGPSADGAVFDASVPPDQREAPLPSFEQLVASLDGLSEEDLELFRQRAVPQPATVMRTPVRLTNESRRDVPSTIVACSYPSEAIMQMAREGNPMMAEVANLRDLELVDLPTGHWPMWSRPTDLAVTISNAACQ